MRHRNDVDDRYERVVLLVGLLGLFFAIGYLVGVLG